jgi:hypothetical protein
MVCCSKERQNAETVKCSIMRLCKLIIGRFRFKSRFFHKTGALEKACFSIDKENAST